MKPYNELTAAGKLHRLRNLAEAALSNYDLVNPKIAFHGFATNLLYRVTAASGERFMLRLAAPGWRTLQDLQSEAFWLDALSRETAIPAPRVLPARSGEHVLPVSRPHIPGIWNITLMTWVPGRQLGCYLTPRNLEGMGMLFAGLHQHGAAWNPPAGFTSRRFEHWLSRGEENLIAGNGRQAAQPHQAVSIPVLPLRHQELIGRMHQHVEQAYAAIDRSDLRVIHCDLWHGNIKLFRGVLYPFDFEDTVWGFRAHDIAMAMLDLMEAVGGESYDGLLAAFRRGYTYSMDWPGDRIEPFQIGRLLWKINWVARFKPHWLERMIDQHLPVFEHYEQTGNVILPTEV